MILKALTLENFKGIREPVRIEFGPLTLLFGPNNAGKSTIVHALMYAREVLERNNCDAGVTQLGGDVVDLGGFRNLVYGHDLSRLIRMRFELDLHDKELPRRTDWVREFGMELGMERDADEPQRGIDFSSIEQARSAISEIWVEVHIGWSGSSQPDLDGKPKVKRYSVGRGAGDIYAEIALCDDGTAAITKLGFGVSPFGTTDYRGETSEFDWILGQLAWKCLIPVPRSSRKDVFSCATEVKDGKSRWVDKKDQASVMERAKRYDEEWRNQAKASGVTNPGPAVMAPEDCEKERIFASIDSGLTVDGEMLDLFDALIHHQFVPFAEGQALPLRLYGTAVPELGKSLELDLRVWMPDYEEVQGNRTFRSRVFVQEYLKELLTSIITGPADLLQEALGDSIYVGPFRGMPPRYYQPAHSPDARRWANGLAAWDRLLLEDKSFAAGVNAWLSGKGKFDSGYEIDVRRYRELELDSPVFAALTDQTSRVDLDLDWLREELIGLPEGRRLTIRDLRSGVSLFPRDLGVGIAQVIPVIVAALHNTCGIVAIEEPESNIHPAFQVVLADLFITQAKANRNVLFLVETHSEHLMLRCLRRIRETSAGRGSDADPKLTPEDIAVHFVEPDDQGQPRIHRIRIDEEGEFLDPWPRGFFRERSRELYGDDL